MNKKAVFLNMTANMLSFAIQLCINFFLTPYIVGELTSEAYAFISLANSFPSYAAVVTDALNGIAGRFISIEIYRGNREETNQYFSSVVLSNVILSLIWIAFTVCFVPNINHILNVPDHLVHDVKILFWIVFFSFSFSLLTNLLGTALYTQNKLYLKYMRSIEGLVIRSVFLVLLFIFFEPKVYFIAIANLAASLYQTAWNLYYTHKYLPFVKIRRAYFRIRKVITLISSGIWNCVNRLGGILNDGLDLLITNLMISTTEMGVLSLSKTIPSLILTLVNIVAGAFSPDITKTYALGKLKDVAQTIKQSMKVMGALVSIPVGGLIGFGTVFYSLWLPTEDSARLQVLSVISVLLLVFTVATATTYNVFTVTNKLKLNSIVVVAAGFLNTVTVLILLKTTNLGIYAVAGVSSVIGIAREYLFTLPYAARCLKMKWYTFYPPALKSAVSAAVVAAICYLYKSVVPVTSWGTLIVGAVICGGLGLLFNLFIVLNKQERRSILERITRKRGQAC